MPPGPPNKAQSAPLQVAHSLIAQNGRLQLVKKINFRQSAGNSLQSA